MTEFAPKGQKPLGAALLIPIAGSFFLPVAAGGSELAGGEGNAAEHFAGVFGAAALAVAAFLFGDGVFHHGHDQLHIPFQPDDGELPQGDVQAAMVSASSNSARMPAGIWTVTDSAVPHSQASFTLELSTMGSSTSTADTN